ncbi:MAG TPA: DUF2339 domain-containing protein [Acidobacteriaceae bacterium]|nr:DUF2339 domain-containing protein [Acidobacteriaceae bacterium]
MTRIERTLTDRSVVAALPKAPEANSLSDAPQPEIPGAVPPHPSRTADVAPAAARTESIQAAVPRFASIVAEPRTGPSLEKRIGSQWFNRIGILAVLIGVAWFLKLAFDNHWIGPAGRVLIGLAAGAALVAWSERFRTHGYVGFSWSLKAIGTGILYLSLWAGFSLYHLIPSSVAFAAMIAVTAFNGFLAWVQDAELLALYAIVGGLSTPALLSTGENHEVALFTYLLLLDLAVLVLVALRPWSRLLCGAFLGTALYVSLWAAEYYNNDEFGTTAFFLACYFLIFALAPRLVRLRNDASPSAWDNLALMVVPVANAGLGFLAYYLMLEDARSQAAEPWVAVAFAAFYLGLLRLPQRGILRESPARLAPLHLATAVVFLTIAIPLKAHGRWLTVGWLVEGGALVWVARQIHSRLLRVLATVCLAMGLVALVVQDPAASTTPIFNERFATYCVGIGVCAFISWVAVQAPKDDDDSVPVIGWPVLAIAAALAVSAIILLSVGWEIHSFWWYLQYRGDWHLLHDYRMYAQFTYSAFFMVFGAVLLGLGFWRRSAFLRWQALLLLAASIGKVFIVDVSQLSQGYRILSFLGLGALLLAVSFVYQKDWLNLRKAEPLS